MSLLLISQAYSLSEDEDENFSSRSENLKTKTLQSSENSLKYDNKSKQKKRKLKCSKANISKTQIEFKNPNSIENPDLFSQWPFNHFKIVFNRKSDKEPEGWKRENNIFVFYENYNLEESKTLHENRNKLKSTTPENLETKKNDPERTSKFTKEDDTATPSFLELLDQMENESVEKVEGHQERTMTKFSAAGISKNNRKQHLKSCGSKTTSDTAKSADPKTLGGKILSTNQCIMCFKQLTKPSQLQPHIRMHIQEKPFSCPICGESFAQLSHVNAHKTTHSEGKPYHCTICNINFKSERTLKNHKQVHSEEKPYHCLICNKMFKWQRVLKAHERTHTGEKPYQCLVCGKSFSSRESLKRHGRIHTGEKPFECSICNNRFARLFTLKNHEKIHISKTEEKYQCFDCGKKFKYQSNLTRHKRSHSKTS